MNTMSIVPLVQSINLKAGAHVELCIIDQLIHCGTGNNYILVMRATDYTVAHAMAQN